MRPALRRVVHGLMVVTFLLLLAGCTFGRHYEAALVLQDFAEVDGKSRLKQTTPTPQRQPVSYAVAGRTHHADLYLPGKLDDCARPSAIVLPQDDERSKYCPRAAIVAVPGAVPQSKDDPRFVAFATTLARAGFAVLAPDLDGFRQLRIRPSNIGEIADAFAYLASRHELAPDGRAGMVAFSYSVGPAILAALENGVREKVRFIVGIGGYYDLPQAMRFFTTGWFEHADKWHYHTPDDTGRMVLAYSSLDYLADVRGNADSDRRIFDQMVTLRREDPKADLSAIASQLSSDAMPVYALAVNSDPARFPELLAQLPAAMQADIERLDLKRYDLKSLKAQLILVHGRSDNLIPYPESLALATAVSEKQTRVTLIHRVLGHVDLSISHLFSWRFWSEDLPDLWRLWRVIDLLLAQREEVA